MRLAALATAMLVLAGLAALAQEGEELLVNPGFDLDADHNGLPDGWSTSAKQIRYREKQFMGKDYEILSQPGAYVLATQPIKLEKGQKYTLRFTARGEEGALAGALIVHGEDRPRREMPLMWNVGVTERYEEYITIFTAPNPVAVLYIYNIAKKGTVYYDSLSLRKGVPDHALISQLSFKPIDRPVGPPPETPHIAWASPLAGGPVKAFFTIRSFRCLRDVVELAQRLDLDYDVVDTGYQGQMLASETGRRATKRLKDGYYEVYVVPSRVPEALVKDIRKSVEAGAGLVVIEGFGQSAKFADKAAWQEASRDHFVRQGVPWEVMPAKILSGVAVGRLGQGRIVRLSFPLDVSRVWGLWPVENGLASWRRRQFEYWEWWESLLARTIVWAAGREGRARLRLAKATPEAFTVEGQNAPQGATISALVRSGREIRFDGGLLRKSYHKLALERDGRCRIAIPADLPQGLVLADVILKEGQGRVVTWASFAQPRQQAARLTELTLDAEAYDPGAVAKLTVTLEAPKAVDAEVEVRLIDAFGRVVARQTKPLALKAGQQQARLAVPLGRAITVHHKVFVRVLVGGQEATSKWVALMIPRLAREHVFEDFVATTWGEGMSNPVVSQRYSELLRGLGFNSKFAGSPYLVTESGLISGGYMSGASRPFAQPRYTADGVRRPCLSDPQVIEQYQTKAAEIGAEHLKAGVCFVGVTDEAELTSRHRRHEVCFSPHCQAAYRQWLQKQYRSLEALNKQWGTKYASWDQVKGARTEDVRGKPNFAPFVDFRQFMVDVWIGSMARITKAYHSTAPTIPVGHSNTFGAMPTNGNDYWKLNTRTGFGWGQEYSEAIKGSAHKAIFDYWRSFSDIPNYGWIGYQHSPAAAAYEPWWLALHDSRGVSYFATNAIDASRSISWALIYPTQSLTRFSSEVRNALRDLREGCGKLFIEYERERPPVAILYSHPSMLVAWCESKADEPVPNERGVLDAYATYFVSPYRFRQLLNELQWDYQFVAPRQILEGDVLRQYPVLFLPFTIGETPQLVPKLEAYVKAGGTLIADARCLRTDQHGTPIADSRHLERLFGVRRKGPQIEYQPTLVKATAGMKFEPFEATAREDLEVVQGRALAQHADGKPALVTRRLGKGRTVYLNFVWPEYSVGARSLVEQLVTQAGVKRDVKVEPVEGNAPPRCYERNSFRRGSIAVHGFIRDYRRCEDRDPVRISFGSVQHLYDVRARKYLGKTASVQTILAPGDTALYAQLPYRVTGLDVQATPHVSPGGELTCGATVRTDGGAPGRHVLHIELRDPDGKPAWHYTSNDPAPGGKWHKTVPLAWNERPGKWTLYVRDVLTGVEGQRAFEVR